jgi:hypothetical protein
VISRITQLPLENQLDTFEQKNGEHVRKFHFLTGGKGGIGKTLVGLSVITSYSVDYRKKILGIDVNTMNTDLFRLLGFKRPQRLDSWRVSVTDEAQTLVARPMNPYVLPNGSKGFWEKIFDLVKRENFKDFDLLIDTNLHISNLESGSDSPFPTIHQIIRFANAKIYLWILWTYATIAEGDTVVSTIGRFIEEFGKDIEFIHVLNPSALMPPRINLTIEIEKLLSARREEEAFMILLGSSFIDQKLKQQMQASLDVLRKDSNLLLEQMKEGELKDFKIKGLDQLWSLDIPIVEAVEHDSFVTLLRSHLIDIESRNFEPLAFSIISTYGGRPQNVLPISTHDPRFIGYTEEQSIGSDLDAVRYKIASVQKEISVFLKSLDPSLSEE